MNIGDVSKNQFRDEFRDVSEMNIGDVYMKYDLKIEHKELFSMLVLISLSFWTNEICFYRHKYIKKFL